MPLTLLNKVGVFIPTLFLGFAIFSTATAQPLADSLTAYLHKLPATVRVSLAVESLTNKRTSFYHRVDERVPSASVIKLPVMLELMERVKAGTFSLDAVHTLTNAEKVSGSGVLQTYDDQSTVSYRELLRLMMVASDNTATNIFINELGMKAINARMRSIGLIKSQLSRVMMDTLAARQGRENYVTAREMNTLLTKIYRHQVATPMLCEQMIDVLKQNEDTLTIPALLPKDIAVAHKTGTLAYVRGDAGIVFAKLEGRAKPFVLSVFVEGIPTSEAEKIIGDLSLICYTWFSKSYGE